MRPSLFVLLAGIWQVSSTLGQGTVNGVVQPYQNLKSITVCLEQAPVFIPDIPNLSLPNVFASGYNLSVRVGSAFFLPEEQKTAFVAYLRTGVENIYTRVVTKLKAERVPYNLKRSCKGAKASFTVFINIEYLAFGYAYLTQVSTLDWTSHSFPAITWSYHQLGGIFGPFEISKLFDRITSAVDDLVELFVNEWKQANKK